MIALVLVLTATMPLGAQQRTTPSATPMRSQILTFEDVLLRAIEVAGDELSKQVQQQLNMAVPIQFGFEPMAPIVRGWPIDSYGYHFAVQVPDVAQTGILLAELYRMPGQQAPRPATEAESRPVASGGVIKDDPMGPASPGPGPGRSATARASAAGFDPIATFHLNVRAALIDAIINNPGVLALRDTDWLAVSTTGMGQSPATRLSPRSARMTLYINGADLRALRDGKLTPEQARARIRESSF
jgi:hypothetical protein